MSEIVGLAGDWHGNTIWARECLIQLAGFNVHQVYHLGDFGIWPGDRGKRYVDRVNATARHFGIDIWVTPGNHEDYDQISALPVGDDGLQRVATNIALIPRGHRWEHGGRSFVSLGGAPSIDFEQRVEGVSWWRGETVTIEEAMAVREAGQADVMLTHDSPDFGTDQVQAIINTPTDKNPWSTAGLRYASEGRQMMDIAVSGVIPALLAHGHYHVAGDTESRPGTRFLALAGDGMPGNVALLQLPDLAVSWDGRTWKPTPGAARTAPRTGGRAQNDLPDHQEPGYGAQEAIS